MYKITLLAAFFGFAASAQPVYNSADFATVGEVFAVSTAGNFIGLDFAQTGAGQNWDYSSMTQLSLENSSWMDPNAAGYKTSWCFMNNYILNCDSQFNSAFNLAGQEAEGFELEGFGVTNPVNHYFLSANALTSKMLGATVATQNGDIPYTVTYTIPDVVYQFPIAFNDNYTNDSSLAFDLNAFGYPLSATGTTSRTNHVEGWGQLVTPAATYASVLKMKTVAVTNQQITFEGESVPLMETVISYKWFDPAFGMPVLEVSGMEVEGIFLPTVVRFVGEALSTNENLSERLSILPNPTSGNLEMSRDILISQVNVYNSMGMKVSDTLDLSNLSSGMYLVEVATAEGWIKQRIIKQ